MKLDLTVEVFPCLNEDYGPVIFKVDNASCSLDWQHISKTILEKAFFFICCVSVFFYFCFDKFEKWPF
jgi:hypothetical protein